MNRTCLVFTKLLTALYALLIGGSYVLAQNAIDNDASRIFSAARTQVVRLIVSGDARDVLSFKPPVYGTGFFVTTEGGQLRIVTAAHVVKRDEEWALLGAKRVKRDVIHIAETDSGNTRFEPVTAVTYDPTKDVAEVGLGHRNPTTTIIFGAQFSSSEPYFVVSWGRDLDTREFPYEPYIRRVKYIGRDSENHELVQLKTANLNAGFTETESGSPVMDIRGRVVGILTNRLVPKGQTDSGRSEVGLALPIAAIDNWLTRLQGKIAYEPPVVRLALLMTSVEGLGRALDDLSGLCIFLGKSSAKNQNIDNPNKPEDVPFGVQFLRDLDSNSNPNGPDFLSRSISVSKQTGALNVRTRCPDVVQKANTTARKERVAFYGAEFAQITPMFSVRLREIRKLDYLEDYFYWGVIDRVVIREQ